MPYCPNCGNPVDEGAKFCQHCGAQLTQTSPKQDEEEQVLYQGFAEIVFKKTTGRRRLSRRREKEILQRKGTMTLTNNRLILGTLEKGETLFPIVGMLDVNLGGALRKSLNVKIASFDPDNPLDMEFELKGDEVAQWLEAFKKLPNTKVGRRRRRRR